MQENIRLYPWYRAACSFLAWMPIFFLYFSEQLGLKDLLILEAIYYLAVVTAEVPSGYFSDVVGRKTTLSISSAFLVLACIFYIIGGSFMILSIAQICFACFMAFQSGTNTVFHFESLDAVNQGDEYGDREAKVGRLSMVSAAISALAGGFLGAHNLRWPFIASLLVAMVGLLIVLRFKEPDKRREAEHGAEGFLTQLRITMAYLKEIRIAWLFFFFVLLYALVHIPYEFYQPYLRLLEGKGELPIGDAPTLSGLMVACTSFIGAYVSGRSMDLKRRFGLKNLCLLALFAMLLVVGIMGTALHVAMIILLLFRNTPMAAVRAPFNEAVTPLIAASQRATFHSLLSLAGRLAFFATLFGLSQYVSKDQLTDWPTLSSLLLLCVGAALILSLPIYIFAGKAMNQSAIAKES